MRSASQVARYIASLPAICGALGLAVFVKIFDGEAPVPNQPVFDGFTGAKWALVGFIHLADQLKVLSIKFRLRNALGSTA